MKYVDEFRDPSSSLKLSAAIADTVSRSWSIMEVCGGQTHSIVRHGLDKLLPDSVSLIHGPGCPVCVTPLEMIDAAIHLASRVDLIFCSFGDMLRVPGTNQDLQQAKAKGGDVRIVYSPLDALEIAKNSPTQEVVFFAVGFETTAPANAMAVYQARENAIDNFSIVVSHVLVPPALHTILSHSDNQVNGILAAGHVCTIMGEEEYVPIANQYGTPIIVTGFEPLDILQGIYLCIKQLERGQANVVNQYSRSVRRHGNTAAKNMINEIFEVVPRSWRGLGKIPKSGLALRDKYSEFDAMRKFNIKTIPAIEPEFCISGQILQGLKKPPECPMFGTVCTPEHPLGATMVSAEGTCSAYFKHRIPLGECSAI